MWLLHAIGRIKCCLASARGKSTTIKSLLEGEETFRFSNQLWGYLLTEVGRHKKQRWKNWNPQKNLKKSRFYSNQLLGYFFKVGIKYNVEKYWNPSKKSRLDGRK